MPNESLAQQLEAAWQRSDLIFSLLRPQALLVQPIGLRHPFLFYLGHLSAFAWNQIGRGVLGLGALHPTFDCLFERGIDPADTTTAPATGGATQWPEVAAVRAYVQAVRDRVLAVLPLLSSCAGDLLAEHRRILHMVIEHEQMHHETLLYMMQACDLGLLDPSPLPPSLRQAQGSAGPGGRRGERRHIDAGSVRLGIDFEATDFGWDNEFGCEEGLVPGFVIDSLPVRNQDYLDYITESERRGMAPPEWPQNWQKSERGLWVRTPLLQVPFAQAAGWPVQVSGLGARAYCAAKGGRLPSEAELMRAAFHAEDGSRRRFPWGDSEPEPRFGRFDFYGLSPQPVGSTPDSVSAWGVEELCGNGWEWTKSPFRPLPGFRAYARTYPGYSADFFDDEHDIVFGASWATARKLLRPSFRNWYRRSYPYVFSKFRVVQGR